MCPAVVTPTQPTCNFDCSRQLTQLNLSARHPNKQTSKGHFDWLWAGQSRDWILVGGDIFCTCPDQPWGPPSLLYNGYRVFPRGKEWLGYDADPHPLLVPWSRKGRAIPLLPLPAVRPVQSLSACVTVHFTLYLLKDSFVLTIVSGISVKLFPWMKISALPVSSTFVCFIIITATTRFHLQAVMFWSTASWQHIVRVCVTMLLVFCL